MRTVSFRILSVADLVDALIAAGADPSCRNSVDWGPLLVSGWFRPVIDFEARRTQRPMYIVDIHFRKCCCLARGGKAEIQAQYGRAEHTW